MDKNFVEVRDKQCVGMITRPLVESGTIPVRVAGFDDGGRIIQCDSSRLQALSYGDSFTASQIQEASVPVYELDSILEVGPKGTLLTAISFDHADNSVLVRDEDRSSYNYFWINFRQLRRTEHV